MELFTAGQIVQVKPYYTTPMTGIITKKVKHGSGSYLYYVDIYGDNLSFSGWYTRGNLFVVQGDDVARVMVLG